jgi:hypothetical protein
MLVAESNGLSNAAMAVRPHIAWLKQGLNDLDHRLRETLRHSPVWREEDDPLRSVPESEARSLLPFWHTCPNWALSTADRSLPGWA